MRTSRWVLATYALLILLGIMPPCRPSFPRAAAPISPPGSRAAQVTLGLDLRGGSHLVLEVDPRTLRKAAPRQPARRGRGALDAAGIAARTGIEAGRLVVTPRSRRHRRRGRDHPAPRPDGRRLRLSSGVHGVRPDGGGPPRPRADRGGPRRPHLLRRRAEPRGHPRPHRPGRRRRADDPAGRRRPHPRPASRPAGPVAAARPARLHRADELPPARPGGRSAAPPPGATAARRGRLGQLCRRGPRRGLGRAAADAHGTFDQRTGEPIVTFRFDTPARSPSPRSRGPMSASPSPSCSTARCSQRAGDPRADHRRLRPDQRQLHVEEAVDLSALLRAGALPVPLTVIEERSVGPDLGSDAIEMGVYAGLAGFALVVGFMVALYGAWGLIANLALALNVIAHLRRAEPARRRR
jgi:SecD/SecF fusion protein